MFDCKRCVAPQTLGRWTLSVLVTDENTTQASSIKPIWMNSPDPPLFASSQQPPPTVVFLSPKKKVKQFQIKILFIFFFTTKCWHFCPCQQRLSKANASCLCLAACFVPQLTGRNQQQLFGYKFYVPKEVLRTDV